MPAFRPLHLLFLIASLGIPLLSGCTAGGAHQQVPPSPIPLRDLLIDVAPFPAGWKLQNIVEDDTGNEIENFSVYYRNPSEDSPVSRHQILRYISDDEAQQDFDLILRHERGYEPSLVPIAQLTYPGHTARRSSLLCMKRDYDPVEVHRLCIAMAQYGSYISSFSAPIDKRFMSYAAYAHILDIIDRKMATVANGYQ